VIARGKEPIVRLTPVAEKPLKRKAGILTGKLSIPDAFFFDPLPEEELMLWEGLDGDPPG